MVVGDVDAGEAKRLVETAFSALPARSGPAPALAPPPAPPTRTEMVEFRDRKQSAIAMTFAAVPPGHADALPLRLLESSSSGLAGTLFAELRGRRSLAYTVFCGYLPRREGGAMLAYMATGADKETEAKGALLAELRRLAADGLTEADFVRGQRSFEGSTTSSCRPTARSPPTTPATCSPGASWTRPNATSSGRARSRSTMSARWRAATSAPSASRRRCCAERAERAPA